MTATEMIEWRSRRPFVPFEIRLTDGGRIRVQEPYQIATRPASPSCAVYGDLDELHILTYRSIIEVVAAPNRQ